MTTAKTRDNGASCCCCKHEEKVGRSPSQVPTPALRAPASASAPAPAPAARGRKAGARERGGRKETKPGSERGFTGERSREGADEIGTCGAHRRSRSLCIILWPPAEPREAAAAAVAAGEGEGEGGEGEGGEGEGAARSGLRVRRVARAGRGGKGGQDTRRRGGWAAFMGGRLTLRAKADAATRVREAARAAAQDAGDPAAALRQPLAAAVAWAGSRAREVNLVVETVARLGLEAQGAAADAVHEADDLGLLVDVLRYRVPVIIRPEVLELWRPVLEILERTAFENGDERQALLEAALWMLLLHDPGSSQGTPSAISAQSAVLTVGGSALFGCDFMQSFESLLKESANSNDKNEREIFLEAAEAELARRAAATRAAQEEHQALLDSCDWIGFDLDNTLVTYESIAARAIRYQAVVRHLKESLTSGVSETSGPDQYLSKVAESIPHELEPKHSWMCEKKCLVLDADEGLILEVDADKWVVFAFLGSALLARSEMDRLGYAEAPIDTSLQRYLILHTEIEQPFAAVLAACLDAEKKRDLVEVRREWLERVRQAFIFVQSKFCPFSFEASLDQDASALVVKRTALVLPWLRRLVKRGGTKLFVLTNADWEHSQRTMDAAFPGQNWRSLFDFIVTSAHKSQFFATASSSGVPKPVVNEIGVFVGGNVRGLADLLSRGCSSSSSSTSSTAKKIVYMGDHFVQDVHGPASCGWQAIAVAPLESLRLVPGSSWPSLAMSLALEARFVVPDLGANPVRP